ncbi:MAG: UxaA family hydrolase [Pseudomonadota bacterium]
MTAAALCLDPADNVATALRPLTPGDVIAIAGVAAPMLPVEPIPAFHKIALKNLPEGALVHKHGAPIGRLTGAVRAGGLVHVHNLKSLKACGSASEQRREGRDR